MKIQWLKMNKISKLSELWLTHFQLLTGWNAIGLWSINAVAGSCWNFTGSRWLDFDPIKRDSVIAPSARDTLLLPFFGRCRRKEATGSGLISMATTWWRRRHRGKDTLNEADDPLPMDTQGITISLSPPLCHFASMFE
jgi:hypothetical protein